MSIPLRYQAWEITDKSSWGDGSWQGEPDKFQFVDAETGYICLGVRPPFSGAWCGYVGVTKDHPCYGKDYDWIEANVEVNVHGGVNYADAPSESDDGSLLVIAHLPEPNSDPDVYWIGFDCCHCYDLMPAIFKEKLKIYDKHSLGMPSGMVYRDVPYVVAQCMDLAAQLHAYAKQLSTGEAAEEASEAT